MLDSECLIRQTGELISTGCYGSVYESKNNPNWVLKFGKNDGTREYLEWCLAMQKRGKAMRGMPEIDFLVSINTNGYLVGMRKYSLIAHKLSYFGWARNDYSYSVHEKLGCPAYLVRLIKRIHKEFACEWFCDDVHYKNVMYCKRTNSVILTDPSCVEYHSQKTNPFTLVP